MSVKNNEITGDASIGRNLSMGGKLKVQGSATVNHNLKVEGWLDAANIRGSNKGIFSDLASLKEAYPHARKGSFAGVLTDGSFEIYIYEEDWTATGVTYTIEAELNRVNEEIEEIEADLYGMKGAGWDEEDTLSAMSEKIGRLMESNVVLSEKEYNQLVEKDSEKFYFTYEDDSGARIEGNKLIVPGTLMSGRIRVEGSIINNKLIL